MFLLRSGGEFAYRVSFTFPDETWDTCNDELLDHLRDDTDLNGYALDYTFEDGKVHLDVYVYERDLDDCILLSLRRYCTAMEKLG